MYARSRRRRISHCPRERKNLKELDVSLADCPHLSPFASVSVYPCLSKCVLLGVLRSATDVCECLLGLHSIVPERAKFAIMAKSGTL